MDNILNLIEIKKDKDSYLVLINDFARYYNFNPHSMYEYARRKKVTIKSETKRKKPGVFISLDNLLIHRSKKVSNCAKDLLVLIKSQLETNAEEKNIINTKKLQNEDIITNNNYISLEKDTIKSLIKICLKYEKKIDKIINDDDKVDFGLSLQKIIDKL